MWNRNKILLMLTFLGVPSLAFLWFFFWKKRLFFFTQNRRERVPFVENQQIAENEQNRQAELFHEAQEITTEICSSFNWKSIKKSTVTLFGNKVNSSFIQMIKVTISEKNSSFCLI